MEKLSRQECLEFMASGTHTGKVATVSADGQPHVVPVWFVVDGDEIVFNTWHETVKAAHIRRDGRVAICVDEEQPPYAFVMIEGTASLHTGTPEERLKWASRIGGRYMGRDRAEEFGKRNGVEGELIVRVKVEKTIGRKDMAA